MTQKPLQELLLELDTTLRSGGPISPDDRALLERVQIDLQAALGSQPTAATTPAVAAPPAEGAAQAEHPTSHPHTLRESVREAVDRLQVQHPRLSTLLSRTLDTLSDLGV